MPPTDCQQLYSHLVTAVIRVGQADDALSLMKDLILDIWIPDPWKIDEHR